MTEDYSEFAVDKRYSAETAYPISPRINVLRDYQTPRLTWGNAGIDIKADRDVTLYTEDKAIIKFGITSRLPASMCAIILPRSGLGTGKLLKEDYIVTLTNSVGLIDPSYTGEWIGVIQNTGEGIIHIKAGDRVAQAVFIPFYLPTNLPFYDESEVRQSKGFGDSGL